MSSSAADLPGLLRLQAERRGAMAAMRQKRLGIWRGWTWREMADEAGRLAAGLAARGVGTGERVLLVGESRPQMSIALIAVQAIGAVPVLPAGDAVPSAALLRSTRLAFVAGQRATERLLDAVDAAGLAFTVVTVDARGLGTRHRKRLEPYESLLAGHPSGALAATGRVGRSALILSGSDGEETRILDHTSLIAAACRAEHALRTTQHDRMVSFMPLGCLPALLMGLIQSLLVGFTLFYPESEFTILPDLREAGPTLLVAPPLLLRQIRRAVFVRAASSRPAWRRALHRALDFQGETSRRSGRISRLLGDVVIRRPVRDHAGLGRVRLAVGFGPAMPPGLAAFLDTLGIGHVCADAVLPQGSNGQEDPHDLALAELALRGSLFLREACVVQSSAGTAAALIWLDSEAVAAWAQSAGIAVASTEELATRPEVQELVSREIAGTSGRLPAALRPTRFLIAATSLSRDAGEINQEGGLVRHAVMRHRASDFARLRDGAGESLACPQPRNRAVAPLWPEPDRTRRDLPAEFAA